MSDERRIRKSKSIGDYKVKITKAKLKQIIKEILDHKDYWGSLGDACDEEVWRDLINSINIHLELNKDDTGRL